MLEASAGTGKTYTIAALAARYVAEGTPLDRLLLITFTRMATGELRDRVRERLVGCEQQLRAILAGAPDPATTRSSTLLASGPHDEVAAPARPARRGPWPTSTRPRSPPRTASARRCWPSSATVGDLDRETGSSRTSPICVEQALDDLYVRRFGPEAGPLPPGAGAADRARGGFQPDGQARAGGRAEGQQRRDALPAGEAGPR